MNPTRLYSIIVPLYNEEEVIEECCKRIVKVLNKTGWAYEIILGQ